MVTTAKVYKPDADTLKVDPGGSFVRAVQKFFNGGMRVGAGAGFTLAGNTIAALLPASQTAAKLVIPLPGLRPGDTITKFKILAQIESAGGTVTLDADLRKLTNAAADPVDASVGAITQVSVTADTAVAAEKGSLTEVVAADASYYILVTGTTAASTDVQVLGALLDITEA